MDLLSAAERLSAIDRKSVVFNTDRCLHTIDKYVECEACYRVCPVEAIAPGKPPSLDQDVCKSCLACLPVCPTGAYTAEDAVPALLKASAKVQEETVELACEAHPNLGTGPGETSIAVRIRGCLAGLGSGAYLALFAAGKDKITVRLDACQDCPWRPLKNQVLAQVEETRTILKTWDVEDHVEVLLDVEGINMYQRPIWDADNPPLSRRDLFRFASERSQLLAARAMNPGSASQTGPRPSANRLRMVAVISQLPDIRQDTPSPTGFATIAISEDCTACRSCERACPNQAIEYSQHEFKTFQLHFEPERCIGCGICEQLCIPEVLTIDQRPSMKAVFGSDEPVLLLEGEITRCERCNIVMAKKPGVTLCPVCEHRRKNPFGGELSPRLLRLIKSRSHAEARNDH